MKKINFVYILFILALLNSIVRLMYGIDYPLADIHGFRQTQTAITSYWFNQEGYTLNYITPLLGPPWSIPFEFPLYQALVSIIVEWTNLPYEIIGRVVNIVIFYCINIVVFFTFKNWGFSKKEALIPVILVLSSPLFVFWSRTFMIEPMTLFFGLISLLFLIKYINNKSILFLILFTFFATLSALTKVTTYAIVLTFAFLIVTQHSFLESTNKSLKAKVASWLGLVIILFVPVLCAIVWNNHADSLKVLNPLANGFIDSASLTHWNFGNLEHRLSKVSWDKIGLRIELIIATIGFLIIGIFSLMSKCTRLLSLWSIIAFISGILVFTKLYVLHEYYFFANALFLLFFVSFGLIALGKKHSFISYGILFVVLMSMFIKYEFYYPDKVNKSKNNSMIKLAKTIEEITDENDILLIYGSDWSPTIPFYSNRKAILDHKFRPITSKTMQMSLNNIKEGQIGAVLFCKWRRKNYSKAFIQQRIKYFGFNNKLIKVGNCDVYLKNKMSLSN